jgi:hypothetical protein
MRWVGHVERHEYKVLAGNPEGKGDIGVDGEDNIKLDLKEIGWEGVDWIHLDRDQWRAVVNTLMNLRVL